MRRDPLRHAGNIREHVTQTTHLDKISNCCQTKQLNQFQKVCVFNQQHTKLVYKQYCSRKTHVCQFKTKFKTIVELCFNGKQIKQL